MTGAIDSRGLFSPTISYVFVGRSALGARGRLHLAIAWRCPRGK